MVSSSPGREQNQLLLLSFLRAVHGASYTIMNLSAYYRLRTFKEPFFKDSEVVGIQSVAWALLFGPFFFWRKGAHIEAILLVLAMTPLMNIEHSDSQYSVILSGPAYLTWLVWIGFAAFAPVLLTLAYQRKRWVEIAGASRSTK
jgi:hypothetical protein